MKKLNKKNKLIIIIVVLIIIIISVFVILKLLSSKKGLVLDDYNIDSYGNNYIITLDFKRSDINFNDFGQYAVYFIDKDKNLVYKQELSNSNECEFSSDNLSFECTIYSIYDFSKVDSTILADKNDTSVYKNDISVNK